MVGLGVRLTGVRSDVGFDDTLFGRMIVTQIYVGVDGYCGRWWDLARGRAAKLRDPVRRLYNDCRGFMAWKHLLVPVGDFQLEPLCVVMSCILDLSNVQPI